MRLPAYPLITVDPFFSIWSRSETLYDAPTTLWCGIPKRLTGFVTVDGKKFRFLGKGKGANGRRQKISLSRQGQRRGY